MPRRDAQGGVRNAVLILQSRTVVLILAPLLSYWVWRLAWTHMNWRFAVGAA